LNEGVATAFRELRNQFVADRYLALILLRSSVSTVRRARVSEVRPISIDTNNLNGTPSPLERKWGQKRSIERGCWQITNELISDKRVSFHAPEIKQHED